jgi:non-homologous end joining protein Ku
LSFETQNPYTNFLFFFQKAKNMHKCKTTSQNRLRKRAVQTTTKNWNKFENQWNFYFELREIVIMKISSDNDKKMNKNSNEERENKRLREALKKAVEKDKAPKSLRERLRRMIREN